MKTTIDQRGMSLREYNARRGGKPLPRDDFEDDAEAEMPSRIEVRPVQPALPPRRGFGPFLATLGYGVVFVGYGLLYTIAVTTASVMSDGKTLPGPVQWIGPIVVGLLGVYVQSRVNNARRNRR